VCVRVCVRARVCVCVCVCERGEPKAGGSPERPGTRRIEALLDGLRLRKLDLVQTKNGRRMEPDGTTRSSRRVL
jgi:hypothetical protein